jgi:hypothetical protein
MSRHLSIAVLMAGLIALFLACNENKVDGDAVDGDTVDGDAVDGDTVDGDEVDGDTVDGDAVDGDAVDGDAVDGDTVDSDAVDGDAVDGDTVDSDAVDGDAVDGDMLDGDMVDGDAVDGDIVDGDLVDGDTDQEAPEETWTDPISGLTWQNGADVGSTGHLWDEASSYCADLEWSGYGDWRLPTISELRTLIRNHDGTVTDGACGVTNDCLSSGCYNEACGDEMPGSGDLYWPPEISGQIDWYWSSSGVTDDDDVAWFASFEGGGVYYYGVYDAYAVRCVR